MLEKWALRRTATEPSPSADSFNESLQLKVHSHLRIFDEIAKIGWDECQNMATSMNANILLWFAD